jgi:predicted dehydrogenase
MGGVFSPLISVFLPDTRLLIMSEKVRWGILGCGKIANKFAGDLRLVKDAVLTAVASRDKDRAREFGKMFGAEKVFDSYEALVTSDVDVIYIATPHTYHSPHTTLCLQGGKAVLCEKPFAMNLKEAKQMVALARRNNVFLMEAFWTKFLPQYKKVIEIVNSGEIGSIMWVQADFGFHAPEPIPARLWDPLLGGGSILDIGIYPVFLAQSLLGKPEEIHASVTRYPSGVDQSCVMVLRHKGGALSSLSSTFAADTPVQAVIAGTKGRIELQNRFHNASSRVFLALNKDELKEVEVYREDGYGYQFEAEHVTQCILKGLKESPVLTHQDTLDLMETLDAIREKCDVRYPID